MTHENEGAYIIIGLVLGLVLGLVTGIPITDAHNNAYYIEKVQDPQWVEACRELYAAKAALNEANKIGD